ncbi:hypothetical protein K0M31_006437 [Melipona bicolor]|uniref:Uncharacterized protein n=1 Tax=Melipona bicolor TaxID=60889 RepID=A0AA40FTJ2_9HYME|nr:hypothetical protein K0M31_006437 [Melipona bicolor]
MNSGPVEDDLGFLRDRDIHSLPHVGTGSVPQVPALHKGGDITQGRPSGQGGASSQLFPGRWM